MFGDYQYGTEIAVIPMPHEEFSHETSEDTQQPNHTQAIEYNSTCNWSDIYWFRWITGHQIMLMFWHLLTKELKKLKNHDMSAAKLMFCLQLMHGCTLIYEYTGSCSKQYYNQYIRPFMLLVHKSFTGTWAIDYISLPSLVKLVTHKKSTISAVIALQKELWKAYMCSQKAHINVAKRLVPEGTSLLQQAQKSGIAHSAIQSHHHRLFDLFFLVDRKKVSMLDFQRNLVRRIKAAIEDLKTHPVDSPLCLNYDKTLLEIIANF